MNMLRLVQKKNHAIRKIESNGPVRNGVTRSTGLESISPSPVESVLEVVTLLVR